MTDTITTPADARRFLIDVFRGAARLQLATEGPFLDQVERWLADLRRVGILPSSIAQPILELGRLLTRNQEYPEEAYELLRKGRIGPAATVLKRTERSAGLAERMRGGSPGGWYYRVTFELPIGSDPINTLFGQIAQAIYVLPGAVEKTQASSPPSIAPTIATLAALAEDGTATDFERVPPIGTVNQTFGAIDLAALPGDMADQVRTTLLEAVYFTRGAAIVQELGGTLNPMPAFPLDTLATSALAVEAADGDDDDDEALDAEPVSQFIGQVLPHALDHTGAPDNPELDDDIVFTGDPSSGSSSGSSSEPNGEPGGEPTPSTSSPANPDALFGGTGDDDLGDDDLGGTPAIDEPAAILDQAEALLRQGRVLDYWALLAKHDPYAELAHRVAANFGWQAKVANEHLKQSWAEVAKALPTEAELRAIRLKVAEADLKVREENVHGGAPILVTSAQSVRYHREVFRPLSLRKGAFVPSVVQPTFGGLWSWTLDGETADIADRAITALIWERSQIEIAQMWNDPERFKKEWGELASVLGEVFPEVIKYWSLEQVEGVRGEPDFGPMP